MDESNDDFSVIYEPNESNVASDDDSDDDVIEDDTSYDSRNGSANEGTQNKPASEKQNGKRKRGRKRSKVAGNKLPQELPECKNCQQLIKCGGDEGVFMHTF